MGQGECVFCCIARRQLSADIVGEEEGLIAFNDTNPQAPVHLLIIPVEHIPSLSALREAHMMLVGRMVQYAARLARQHSMLQDGYRVVINCGFQAGQSVEHLHLHVLGGRALHWPPG